MKTHLSKMLGLALIVSGLFAANLYAQNTKEFKLEPIGEEAFQVMKDFLNYDQGITLDTKVVATYNGPEFTREKIVFNGTHNTRVPGYLVVPKQRGGPFPCVLLLHGFSGSKNDWWQDDSYIQGGLLTKQLVASGYAVLALDAQYHGELIANNEFQSPRVFAFEKKWHAQLRDMHGQTVKDYRLALDYLETRKEIDSSRIGAVGYSMGGMMVFNLSAIDARVKVSVAAVAPVIKKQHSVMGTINFAPYITKQPFLMLMGTTDQNYSMEEAQTIYKNIGSKTKNIHFYEGGHRLPKDWVKTSVDWLETYLK